MPKQQEPSSYSTRLDEGLRNFFNALSEAVAKHIDLLATRLETLSWLAFLIMQH